MKAQVIKTKKCGMEVFLVLLEGRQVGSFMSAEMAITRMKELCEKI